MPDKVHLSDATLRSLFHLLSHDLRNPLAAIVTNLEFAKRLLSQTPVDQDLTESVEDSAMACDVLRRIVSNFDVLVKGERLMVTIHEVEVMDVVREVLRRCKDRAAQATVEITLQEEGEIGRAMLDRSMFALTLENLLSNSIQHSPRGSVARVVVRRLDDGIRLTLHDRGGAISEELRTFALEPEAHTASGRRDGSRYGRGLGLLSARAAACATGIELSVGGEGVDSQFTLDIPAVTTSE